MSQESEILNKIGIQKIHKDTHIPLESIEAIIQEDYTNFTRIQYLGFISIMEKEYAQELSALKEHALEYFTEKSLQEEREPLMPIVKEKKKSYLIYITLIVIAVLIFAIVQFVQDKKVVVIDNVDNSRIAKVNKNIEVIIDVNETNSSDEVNATLPKETQIVEPIVQKQQSLTIMPKSRVWIGYIDKATNHKKQKTFSGKLSLDPKKSWLLLLGHGYVSVEIDGKIQKFTSKGNIRFLYEDGELSKISIREFKKLNRGKKW